MGSVVISVEVDPGLADESPGGGTSDGTRDRLLDAWRRASSCFDRRRIPATWLVAGTLFAPTDLEQSVRDHDDETTTNAIEDEYVNTSRPMLPPGDETDASPCVHPDPEEPAWSSSDSAGDWTETARSVPELIEGIQRSRVGHEIGCLPFSELDIDESSQGDAAATVRATFDDAATLGIETDWLRSFAFSNGGIGHHDVLAAYGFECYPGDPEDDSKSESISDSNSGGNSEQKSGSKSVGALSSLTTLLGLFVRRIGKLGPRLVEPKTDEHGLLAIPTSMDLFPLAGRARHVAQASKRDPVSHLAKRGVGHAAENDGVFHLSIRLSDLRTEADFDRLEAVLDHVAAYRREAALSIETLGQIARRFGEHAPTPAAPVR